MPGHRLRTGWLELTHGRQVALQALADRLALAAQPVVLAQAALLFQVGVELVPRREPRDRHHEVAPALADQTLDGALVITLAGPTVAIRDHVVRQERTEQGRPLARAVGQDLRHQAAIVVVEGRQRLLAKEGRGMNMAVHPRLGNRRRIGPHKGRIAVRQVEGEERRLLLDAADHHQGFAEIRLHMARRVRQWHEHRPVKAFMIAHILLDDRVE